MRGFWAFIDDLSFWIFFIAIAIPVAAFGWRVLVVLWWMLLAAILYPVDKVMMLVSPSYRGRSAQERGGPRRTTLDQLGKAQRNRLERKLAKARKRAADAGPR